MKLTYLFSGSDGKSRFEDLDVPLLGTSGGDRASSPLPATGIVFHQSIPNSNWHTIPHRQFRILLDGHVEIEAGDGTRRRFSPGDVLLLEDTTGQGHRTYTLGGLPFRSAAIATD